MLLNFPLYIENTFTTSIKHHSIAQPTLNVLRILALGYRCAKPSNRNSVL